MTQIRSEETRSRILAAAESLFATKGYDACGVTELCAAAGVSKGAFYYHFPSKQDVFLALMASWLSQLDKIVERAMGMGKTVTEGLALLAESSPVIFEGANTRSLIILEFWMQAVRQPDIWQKAVAPYHHYLEVFAGLFRQAAEEGAVDPGVDPVIAARLTVALSMGLLLQAFLDPRGTRWEEITRTGLPVLLNGLQRKQE